MRKTSWGKGEKDAKFQQSKGDEIKFNYGGIAARIIERLEASIAQAEGHALQRSREETNRQLADRLTSEFKLNFRSRRRIAPSEYSTGEVKVYFEATVTEEEARKILQGLAQFEAPKS